MTNARDIVGEVFGWIATVISVCFFIAPIVPYIKLIKGKITYKETPGLLLICSFLNCLLWVVYGIKLSKTQLYVTNIIGGLVTLVWFFIFLIFWLNKHALKSTGFIVLSCAVVAGIFCLFYYAVDPKKDEAKITGYVAMVFNVLMYASVGEKIYTVIKTKNHNLIPIFSTIFSFLNGACWFIYGVCGEDIDVIVPNALGIFFAILQGILYYVIKCKYHKDSESKKNGEDNGVEKNDEKNSPEVIKVNTKADVPDSNKKLEIQSDKNSGTRVESERVNVNKS